MSTEGYPERPKQLAIGKYKKLIELAKETIKDEAIAKEFMTRFCEIMSKTSYTEIQKEYYLENKERLNKARAEKTREKRQQEKSSAA